MRSALAAFPNFVLAASDIRILSERQTNGHDAMPGRAQFVHFGWRDRDAAINRGLPDDLRDRLDDIDARFVIDIIAADRVIESAPVIQIRENAARRLMSPVG